MAKIILCGHPASQHIVRASKYLLDKYMPGFEVIYLNYPGPIEEWSRYVAGYLSGIRDEKIIFALDDYFLEGPTDMIEFQKAWDMVKDNMIAAKLCDNTFKEFEDYPITTQYCIWNRQFLIRLLNLTTSPWDFEMRGSAIFQLLDDSKLVALMPCMKYNVHTALSKRWEGINWGQLSTEDINIIKNEYING